MKFRRVLLTVLKVVAALVLLIALVIGSVWIYFHPSYTRTDNLVYSHRQGQELTIDMVKPAHPNGVGVLLLVSGGWKSGKRVAEPFIEVGDTGEVGGIESCEFHNGF